MSQFKTWIDEHFRGDPIIWGIVILLSLFSILVVYSATGSLAYKYAGGNTELYLIRHSTLVFVSLLVMWLAHKVPYKNYALYARLAMYLSMPLLLITYLFGSNINEANRWLTIPVINQAFQPSDLAKLALIAALAAMLAKRQNNIKDFKSTFLPIIIAIGLICLLIALANMSTAILLLATCLLIMFIGRVPVKYLLIVIMVGILGLTSAVFLGQRGDTFVARIEAFMDESEVPFQAEQSYIAIATGGVTGKGPGNSEQRNSLPHPYSDFIYAIIIEEYGLVGGVSVLFLYLALLYRGMRIVSNSNKAFGGLLSAGLSFALVIQALVNMAVAVGLGPITGLPLPLLSMGGTSLVFTGISLGIILSVSRGDHQDEIQTGSAMNRPKLKTALS
ncbi:MAG TPA: cell division protein FtsW [Algoriphagus sp.]|jgi:cell division protein FtsW|uniref:Probable peptidoglycan glycosyltransferase FtsW n=1 Tax=Algoriphagus ornithinivorans TaxID=226506 RepID=A0A1I5DL05_9BACT|nr:MULTISPECIES: FtsW/RodA/SpoVE family cell cycle protein [Algoriphagus]MAL14426.1 cell division protein FtsW [Algoriphagus sp.]MAN87235.1 cell division protein FtsW [Algoriphagus sp.]QYH40973.1 FtsW/RodA/SpoVE family cell cycle protein [Algoriphagus sp. NBT04N3]SFN99939.1 cell division protein FtsW [Algoriphagus ornithinivorans]HAD50222.1 cell division protein FtsW [Algoriphagus sp.]|tara:strand:+ start:8679 stop:9848 length:1170 start_codon:yes stop_codon:yes gene_type:complete